MAGEAPFAGLAGEAPFARPKSTHIFCCWGYWPLSGLCSLESLDYVVCITEANVSSEPENNRVTACG